MKVGDSVAMTRHSFGWDRIGLVLGFKRDKVLVFWGEDFPCEEEYPEQLVVM